MHLILASECWTRQYAIEEKETALKHRTQELDEIVRLGRRAKAEQLSEGIMKKKTDRDSTARKLPEISY